MSDDHRNTDDTRFNLFKFYNQFSQSEDEDFIGPISRGNKFG